MKNRLGCGVRGIGTRKVRTVAQWGSGEVQLREPMSPGEAIIKALDARPYLRKIRRNAWLKVITAVMAQPSKKRERARKARRAIEREHGRAVRRLARANEQAARLAGALIPALEATEAARTGRAG